MDILPNYPGNKGADGVFHRIVNCIRPHHRYIEPCLGSGAIMRRKRRALCNIGNDLDADVYRTWQQANMPWIELHNQDAMTLLQTLSFASHIKTVVYLDPPYPLSSRRSGRAYYRHEMTDKQHEALLDVAKSLPCDVLISTYENPLYARLLKDWHCLSIPTATHQGAATEYLYMNYPQPRELHEYTYLGDDWIARQEIRRKVKRHLTKLQRLPELERNAILSAIEQWRMAEKIEQTAYAK